ncbi:hypothetical protein BD779DRAFT_1521538 [Infundibulicybe gibba]|nr:hypothetical protein BD779DRAFT_1521538 [Infundibulicybe gibba]
MGEYRDSRDLDTVGVVAVWLESVLYGIYVTLFFESAYIVIRRNQKGTSPEKVFIWASMFMFLLATSHLGLNLYRLIRSSTADDPFYYWAEWCLMTESSLNALMILFADSLLVYRCFIIWGDSYRIITVPLILLISVIVMTIVEIRELATPFPAEWVEMLGSAIYILVFIQDMMTTGLIAWNIWSHQQQVDGFLAFTVPRSSLTGIVRIMVESAAIYLVELFLLIVLLLIKHPASTILHMAIVPTAGIVFTLITVRISIKASTPPTPDTSDTYSLPTFKANSQVDTLINYPEISFENHGSGNLDNDTLTPSESSSIPPSPQDPLESTVRIRTSHLPVPPSPV